MNTTVIKSNRIILPGGEISAGYVVISNGVIVDILHHFPPDFGKLFDVGDKVLMPGVIDTHVHINEPGRSDWEGFDTATRASLAGGITTLVDMPLNSLPVTTTTKAFDEKIRAAQNKLHVNCGFWGGVVPGNEDELERLVQRGVLGFKAFLTHSGIEDFPNVTERDLEKAMPVLAKYHLPFLNPVPSNLAGPSQSHLQRSVILNPLSLAAVHNTGRATWREEIPPHAFMKSPFSRSFISGNAGE